MLSRIRLISTMILIFFIVSIFSTYLQYAEATIYSSISGSVIDSVSKQGISGVLVLVISDPPDVKVGLLTTKTNEKGNYNLEPVPSGKYTLSIIPPIGYYPNFETKDITVIQGKNIVNLNFELSKTGSISGIAYQSDGVTPMSNIPIFVSTPEGSFGAGETDTNGNFLVSNLAPSESTTLKVWTFGQFSINLYGVKITSASVTENIKVIFPTDGPISLNGTVTSSANFLRVKDAIVTITNEDGIGSTKTDSEGKYFIRGVSPGIYDATASAIGFQGIEEPIVEEKAINITLGTITTKDFVLIPESSGSSIFGIQTQSSSTPKEEPCGRYGNCKKQFPGNDSESIAKRLACMRAVYKVCKKTPYPCCLADVLHCTNKLDKCDPDYWFKWEACVKIYLFCIGVKK